MKTLKEWLGFCQHTYEVFNTHTKTYTDSDKKAIVYVSQCSKCGKIKTKEVG